MPLYLFKEFYRNNLINSVVYWQNVLYPLKCDVLKSLTLNESNYTQTETVSKESILFCCHYLC